MKQSSLECHSSDDRPTMALFNLADSWRHNAHVLREEAARMRKTIKAPTEAEMNCFVRASMFERCASELADVAQRLDRAARDGGQ